MHDTVEALDQAAGRGGGVLGCTQPPPPLRGSQPRGAPAVPAAYTVWWGWAEGGHGLRETSQRSTELLSFQNKSATFLQYLLTFMVHLSQPRNLSQGSPERQNPWDTHVHSTYTRMYVCVCYEYIPLALFLCRTLTHTHTQAFITRSWLMRFGRLSLTIHSGSQESWWFHF